MSALLGLVYLKPVLCAGEWCDRDDVPASQEKIYDCLLQKIKGSMAWEGGGTPPQTASVQHAGVRSIWCLSDAAQKWASQCQKGPKISSLSRFLGLSYLTGNSYFTTPFIVAPSWCRAQA